MAARSLLDYSQVKGELRKARESAAPDALAALHERIEERFRAWLDGPQDHPDPEIAVLDRQAAALLRAQAEATLGPLEASLEAARRRALEILGK